MPLQFPVDPHLTGFCRRTTITIDCCEKGSLIMSENVTAEASPGDQLKIVADALETAVETAKNGAMNGKATVEGALPAASRFLSRFVYTTTYTVSYGIVFPTILITKSIPTNNPVVHGFIDGAWAARERADQLTTQKLSTPPADATPSLQS